MLRNEDELEFAKRFELVRMLTLLGWNHQLPAFPVCVVCHVQWAWVGGVCE